MASRKPVCFLPMQAGASPDYCEGRVTNRASRGPGKRHIGPRGTKRWVMESKNTPRDSIGAAIESLNLRSDFPGLPESFSRVLRVAPDANDAFDVYLEVLQGEPAFAAKVLKIANSPLFRGREPITGLRGALVRLGTNLTRNTVLSAAVLEVLQGLPGLLRHSVACASFSARVGAMAQVEDADALFAAGLLHDLGKLLFMTAKPGLMERRTACSGPAGLDEERMLFGLDHTQLAGWFAREWLLPKECVEAMELHHGPLENASLVTQLVAQGNKWTANYYDVDLRVAPDTERVMVWAEEALGLSRDRFLDACMEIPGDVARLTRHIGAPQPDEGDVVRLLQRANIALGEASLHSEAERRDALDRAQQLSLLHELAYTAATADGEQQICERTVNLIQDQAAVEVVSIVRLNTAGELRVRAAAGLPMEVANAQQMAGPISRWVHDRGEPLLIRDLSKSEDFQPSEYTNRYTTASVVSVPIKHSSEVFGVLNVNNRADGEPFNENDQHFFETVGYNLGAFLLAERERGRRERSDSRFRALVTRAPIPMAGFDQEGRVWLWNQALQSLTGLTANEVLGKPVPAVLLPSEDPNAVQQWISVLWQGRSVDGREHVVESVDGVLRTLIYNIFAVEEYSLGVWVAVDVTEEREAQFKAERRAAEIDATQHVLKDLLSNLDETSMFQRLARWLAVVMTAKQSLVLVRREEEGVFEVKAHHGFEPSCVPAPDERGFPELLEWCLDSTDSRVANEATELPPDAIAFMNAYGNWNVAAAPLRSQDALMGALLVFNRQVRPFSEGDRRVLRDMANVAAVALRIVRSYYESVHNEQLRTAVAMAVSFNHEVNNPLQTILSAAELASTRSELPDEVHNALNQIKEAVNRIASVNAKLREAIQQSTFRTYPGGQPMFDLSGNKESDDPPTPPGEPER